MDHEFCSEYSHKRIWTHHYSFDQKLKKTGITNFGGNIKLLNSVNEFNIFEFDKIKLIAISVDLTMDSDDISFCEIMVLSAYDLQINTAISSVLICNSLFFIYGSNCIICH